MRMLCLSLYNLLFGLGFGAALSLIFALWRADPRDIVVGLGAGVMALLTTIAFALLWWPNIGYPARAPAISPIFGNLIVPMLVIAIIIGFSALHICFFAKLNRMESRAQSS